MKPAGLFRRLVAATLALAVVAQLPSAPPAWWTTRGVLTSGATANDYAAANLGQVKQIATKAYAEMEAVLPGGAGSSLTALVNSWSAAPASGVVRNDYAAVNQGQLKALAKLFYDRLAQFDYYGPPLTVGQAYPWTITTADDNAYAAVNLGQVKYLFSFDPQLALIGPDTDSDGDGLLDRWEIKYFGTLAQSASGDPDGDGVSNLLEFQLGRDPTKPAVADTAGTLNLRLYSPTR